MGMIKEKEQVSIPLLGLCTLISIGEKLTKVAKDVPINIDCNRPMGFKREVYYISNEFIRRNLFI